MEDDDQLIRAKQNFVNLNKRFKPNPKSKFCNLKLTSGFQHLKFGGPQNNLRHCCMKHIELFFGDTDVSLRNTVTDLKQWFSVFVNWQLTTHIPYKSTYKRNHTSKSKTK
jgi:hypothetical protein